MFADAIKAKIPLIGVVTDDLVNAEDVVQSIAGSSKKVRSWPVPEKTVVVPGVYWTADEKQVTLDSYQRMRNTQSSLVVLNPKPSPLLLNVGVLPAPPEMLEEALSFIHSNQREIVIRALKGLSIKTAYEIAMLTVARTGGVNPVEIRKTRLMLSGGQQGLIQIESESEQFYEWPPKLLEWISINQKYFENPNTPYKLLPRGLMLAGGPGTGKTAAARAIAHKLQIPLYRLDIATALSRWQGESENQVRRNLEMAEQESPCVLLIDEAEKIFTHSDEGGTVTRILSTLLWWLNEHRSRIITMMTTNNLGKIPPELYRPGRLDTVLQLPSLSLKDAKQFCLNVYKDVMGVSAPLAIQGKLREAVEAAGKGELSHAETSEIVYESIKTNGWFV